jgi:hypothetical protein
MTPSGRSLRATQATAASERSAGATLPLKQSGRLLQACSEYRCSIRFRVYKRGAPWTCAERAARGQHTASADEANRLPLPKVLPGLQAAGQEGPLIEMSDLPPGTGSETLLGGLRIRVDVSYGGWRYRIWRDRASLAAHEPCWPENQSEALARIEAVSKALEILRWREDPERVAAQLDWK